MVMMTAGTGVTSLTAAPRPQDPRAGITSGSAPLETSAYPGPFSATARTTART